MRHGSKIDPPNRFESIRTDIELEQVEWDQEFQQSLANRKVEYLPDATKTIISENHSPDIPFRYSLNPYRGCEHGCSYCYARPTHEYLGLNAGLDFETRIVVKEDAPILFREFLSRPSWQPEPITFSGVTDCYQPAERKFRLTRQCIEVAVDYRQPISIITKNALVVRDIELLKALASDRLVHVYLSLTTLDQELARDMEPRTSIPAARLRAIEMLRQAQIPVGVMTAPVIPGLNDFEIPKLLEQASNAGAQAAGYVLLRLPLTVEPVFLEWLRRARPQLADKVENRIKSTRGGSLNDPNFGSRMRGQGEIAAQIGVLFKNFAKRFGLDQPLPPYNLEAFRPARSRSGQLWLF